eukprot:3689244-Pleurochrysis_carterae.AAC.1
MAVFLACPLSSTSRGSPFVTAHQTLQCRLWMPTAFLSKIPHLLLAVADAKMTLKQMMKKATLSRMMQKT